MSSDVGTLRAALMLKKVARHVPTILVILNAVKDLGNTRTEIIIHKS